MTYIYAYLAICCICYYQTYELLIERYGSIDFIVEILKSQYEHEYGKEGLQYLSDKAIKVILFIVLFIMSPFIIMGRVLK